MGKTGREIVLTKPRKTPVKHGSEQESTINTAERAVLSAAVICARLKEEISSHGLLFSLVEICR